MKKLIVIIALLIPGMICAQVGVKKSSDSTYRLGNCLYKCINNVLLYYNPKTVHWSKIETPEENDSMEFYFTPLSIEYDYLVVGISVYYPDGYERFKILIEENGCPASIYATEEDVKR